MDNNQANKAIESERSLKLLSGGSATVDQIMEVAFGEWPLKGLSIRNQDKWVLPLESFHDEKGPYAFYSRKNGTIRVNSARMGHENSLLPTAVLHECIHFCQRQTESYYTRTGLNLKDTSAIEVVDSQIQLHTNPDIREQYSKSRLFTGREIQPRLLQVLADGYKSWGRMPADSEELTGALRSAGLNIPHSNASRLEVSQSAQTAKENFWPIPESSQNPAIKDLNIFIEHLSPKGKELFLDHSAPLLYGEALEMLGDEPGRARFNLGSNPRLGMYQKQDTHLQEALRLPWHATTFDGGPALSVDYGGLDKSSRVAIEGGLGRIGIIPFKQEDAWPPIDNPDTKWTIAGEDLNNFNRLRLKVLGDENIHASTISGNKEGVNFTPESMKQAGKATIPGMVAAGAAAAITAVTMAAGGAQASEIKRAVIDQATPDAVKHIQKGEYGKAVAEVAGGALSTAFGAAVGGASAGAVFGLPGAIVGGVGGAVLGGLGLHDKAKKGFEVLIGEGKSYISGLFNGNAKGEMVAPAPTPDIPALIHQAQQQQNLLAPRR